jgi:hypothetical protein
MAILLYANGLTEEYRPKEFTFTDEELLKIFPDFDKTRTFRLYEIPNCWCVWGENEPTDKRGDEFNKIGTDILEQICYSAVLFLHDSEIDPEWKLTDSMIFTGYEDFRLEMLKFFDDIAVSIMEEREKIRQQHGYDPRNGITIDQIGISEDKRIIFKFDLDKQTPEFFKEDNLLEFAQRVHDFLKFKYQDGHIFAILADKNTIMVMDDEQVGAFIEKLIAFFRNFEKYEACSVLRNTYEKWSKFKSENSVKKPDESDDKKESK